MVNAFKKISSVLADSRGSLTSDTDFLELLGSIFEVPTNFYLARQGIPIAFGPKIIRWLEIVRVLYPRYREPPVMAQKI